MASSHVEFGTGHLYQIASKPSTASSNLFLFLKPLFFSRPFFGAAKTHRAFFSSELHGKEPPLCARCSAAVPSGAVPIGGTAEAVRNAFVPASIRSG